MDPRHKSRLIVDGPDRAAARSYFKAVGFTDQDLARPLVGVAHCWIEITPCNWNHQKLAEKVKEGVRAAGGTPIEYNTVSVTDGIAMGTEGMKGSLVSREVVADSIELVARGHLFDAVVAISGCDKTIPGTVMALARLNLPGVMLYGGSIMPGSYNGRQLTVQDVFEAIGAFNAGRISAQELNEIESRACPGAGACGGQFTANTMATTFAMMGISPMGYNDVPATDPRKEEVAFETGKLVMELLRQGVTPRQIMTRKAFLNGIAGAMATGGSTNVVLHLLAVAKEAGVRLSIDDFDRVSRKVPVLADLKPAGRFAAPDMYQAGGMAVDRPPAPRRRPAPRGRDDGVGPHDRRGGARGARDAGAGGHPAALEPAEADRRHGDPARELGAGRLRPEGRRGGPGGVTAGPPGSSTARRTRSWP